MTNRKKLHVVLDSVVAVSAFLTEGLTADLVSQCQENINLYKTTEQCSYHDIQDSETLDIRKQKCYTSSKHKHFSSQGNGKHVSQRNKNGTTRIQLGDYHPNRHRRA